MYSDVFSAIFKCVFEMDFKRKGCFYKVTSTAMDSGCAELEI